jgi:hypothetical protein
MKKKLIGEIKQLLAERRAWWPSLSDAERRAWWPCLSDAERRALWPSLSDADLEIFPESILVSIKESLENDKFSRESKG